MPPSFARQRSLRAMSAISVCDGARKLSGICTASTPPGATIVATRANNAAWSGSQCSAALL